MERIAYREGRGIPRCDIFFHLLPWSPGFRTSKHNPLFRLAATAKIELLACATSTSLSSTD
jgi:hypothetical protein